MTQKSTPLASPKQKRQTVCPSEGGKLTTTLSTVLKEAPQLFYIPRGCLTTSLTGEGKGRGMRVQNTKSRGLSPKLVQKQSVGALEKREKQFKKKFTNPSEEHFLLPWWSEKN